MKALPKKIYAYLGSDTDQLDDEYLHTSAEPGDLVETGENRRVGVYELVGYAEIKNITTTTEKPPKQVKK